MENTDTHNNKVPVAAKVDPAVLDTIVALATDDERTISNTIERLLKSHPKIRRRMSQEEAHAAA
jgi:hypothetical protein